MNSSQNSQDTPPTQNRRRSRFRIHVLVALACVVVSLPVAWFVGTREVAIEVDVYPPLPESRVLEFSPNPEDSGTSITQALRHPLMAGSLLRLELHAVAEEAEKLSLALQYGLVGESSQKMFLRHHEACGDLRTTTIEMEIGSDIDPSTLSVMVFLSPVATRPVKVLRVSAFISPPPWNLEAWPSTTPTSEIDVMTDQWTVSSDAVRPIAPNPPPSAEAAPILAWGNNANETREMATVPSTDSTVPRLYDIQITSFQDASKNGDEMQRTYLEIDLPEEAQELVMRGTQDPPESWSRPVWGEGSVVVTNNRPNTTYRWSQWVVGEPRFQLLKTPAGGPVLVRSNGTRQIVDTFSESTDEWAELALEPIQTIRRYTGTVPRRALKSLRLESTDGSPLSLRSFYIGTTTSQRFTRSNADTTDQSTHWIPNVREGAVSLRSLMPWEHGGWLTYILSVCALLSAYILLRLFISALPNIVLFLRSALRGLWSAWQFVSHPKRYVPVYKWVVRTLTPPRPRITIPIIVVLSLTASAALTAMIRQTPVTIGLDLANDAGELPILRTMKGQRVAQMEAISDQFSPGDTSFTVSSTRRKNDKSDGLDIVFSTIPRDPEAMARAERTPKRIWSTRSSRAFTSGEMSATLAYERQGEHVILQFSKNSHSGIARIDTEDGTEFVDLYSEEPEYLEVPVAARSWARYYTTLPRGKLSRLEIDLGTAPIPEIKRLFIGTLNPQIYFGAQSYPLAAQGNLNPNYEFATHNNTILLPPLPYWDRGGIVTFSLLSTIFFVLVLVIVAILSETIRYAKAHVNLPHVSSPTLHKLDLRTFMSFFVPLIAVHLVYLGSFYPGGMSVEGLTMWDEAHLNELDDTNPVGYTLWMMVLIKLWDSPALIALVQCVALDALLAYALSLVLRAGAPPRAVWTVFAIALISPRIGSMPLWLYRDVPYAVIMFAYTLSLARIALMPQIRARWSSWLLPGALVSMLPFFRHEGKGHLVLFGALGLLLCWHERKRVIVVAVAALVTFVGVKQAIYPLLNVEGATTFAAPPFWKVQQTTQSIVVAMEQDLPLSQDTYTFADEMGCPSLSYSAPYIFNIGDSQNVEGNILESGRLDEGSAQADSIVRHYPRARLDDTLGRRLERAPYLVGITDNIRQGLIPPIINTDHAYLVDRKYDEVYGLVEAPLFNGGHKILRSIIDYFHEHQRWLYGQPVINIYVVLVAIGILLARGLDWRYLVVFAPAVLNTAMVFAANASTSCRYHFSLTFASGFLFCFALLRKPSQSTQPEDAGN